MPVSQLMTVFLRKDDDVLIARYNIVTLVTHEFS